MREYISSPLFRNAAYLWGNSILLAAFGFVFWAAAARLYTADAVGYAASAMAAMALIAGFSNLGFGLGTIRFLPERKDSGAILINSVLLSTVGAGLVASLIFLLGLDLWSPGLTMVREHPAFSVTFVVGAIAVSLSAVLDQVFVATRTATLVLMKNLGLSLSRLVLVLALASSFASFGIVAAHGLAAVVLVAVSLFYLLPIALKDYRPAVQWRLTELSSIFSFSIGNHVSSLLVSAPGTVFTIIVLNTIGPESAAYFYVAWTIGQVVSGCATSLSLSLFAEGSQAPDEVRGMAFKAFFGGSLVALAAALTLLVAAEPVLLVFGGEYASNGSNLLRILGVSLVPHLLLNLYLGVARVQKRIGSLVLVTSVMAATSLVTGYVLASFIGLEGVGIGWLAGQSAALAVVAILLAWPRSPRLFRPRVLSIGGNGRNA